MRRPLRSSDFSHSRSFSAPTVPVLRLTPPTPHGSVHPTDYDSDDSIPTSAAAMPRPNRYRRPTNNHPYTRNSQASSSSTYSREQYRPVNPTHFQGTYEGQTLVAFSMVQSPDGVFHIQGKLVPDRLPSQEIKQRSSLSQPSSPLFFCPIDPSITGGELQGTMSTTKTDSVIGSPQHQRTISNTEQEYIVPMFNNYVEQTANTAFEDYQKMLQAQLGPQSVPMWPVSNQFPCQ